ncbi:TRI59 protein, partial [Dasyornis broadbenti]|nr:TRI59 protein [Dasyornis broadbenti]
MDRLEEELSCAICCDIFEDPRVLPCSHTFCRACLQGLLQPEPGSSSARCLSCPSCRARVAVPAAGPESLPINFALKAVIDKCQQGQPAGAGAGPGAGMCREHLQQPLNVYCVQDKRLVCGQCLTVGKHRGHPIDDLQSAYSKAREALGKILEELTDKSEVSSCTERLQQNKAQCQRAVERDREAVLKYFNELGDALECKKAAVLSVLDKLGKSISEEYDPLIAHVEKLKLEENELKELHSAVQKEESPLLFLEKLDGLQQQLHALKRKRLPDTEPMVIYPRMVHLMDSWSKTAVGKVGQLRTPEPRLMSISLYRWHRHESILGLPHSEPGDWRSALVLILFSLLLYYRDKFLPANVPAPLADLWEFLLRIYQDSCIYLQNTVQELCHSSDTLMEFCRRVIP